MCRLVRWFEKNVHLSVYVCICGACSYLRVKLAPGSISHCYPSLRHPQVSRLVCFSSLGPSSFLKAVQKKECNKKRNKKGAERKYIMSENTDIADDVEVHNAPVYTIIPVYKTLTYKPF